VIFPNERHPKPDEPAFLAVTEFIPDNQSVTEHESQTNGLCAEIETLLSVTEIFVFWMLIEFEVLVPKITTEDESNCVEVPLHVIPVFEMSTAPLVRLQIIIESVKK
jgi:hypothetical protein